MGGNRGKEWGGIEGRSGGKVSHSSILREQKYRVDMCCCQWTVTPQCWEFCPLQRY